MQASVTNEQTGLRLFITESERKEIMRLGDRFKIGRISKDKNTILVVPDKMGKVMSFNSGGNKFTLTLKGNEYGLPQFAATDCEFKAIVDGFEVILPEKHLRKPYRPYNRRTKAQREAAAQANGAPVSNSGSYDQLRAAVRALNEGKKGLNSDEFEIYIDEDQDVVLAFNFK